MGLHEAKVPQAGNPQTELFVLGLTEQGTRRNKKWDCQLLRNMVHWNL